MVTFGLSPCTVAVQYFNAPFSAPTFLHSILICFPASYGLQRWPLIHPSPETYLSTVDDVSRQRDSKHSNSNTMMPPPSLSLSFSSYSAVEKVGILTFQGTPPRKKTVSMVSPSASTSAKSSAPPPATHSMTSMGAPGHARNDISAS
jgi:hypothetical protein